MSTTEESPSGPATLSEPDATSGPTELTDTSLAQTTRQFPTNAGLVAPKAIAGATTNRRGSSAAMFIVGMALLSGLLAWIWASSQGDRYSATAVVQLEPADTIEESSDVVDVVGSLDRGTIVVTAAGVASSGVVTTAAQQQLGLTATQAEDYEVESLQVLTSHLIDITVTGPDEALAIDYADAIAEELQASFALSYPVYQISTVTPAAVPDSSGRPGVIIIVIAAMIAAAIGAFMLWLALFGGSDERTDLPMLRRN